MNKHNQHGFGHIGLVLVLVVAGVVGFAGYRVASRGKDTQKPVSQAPNTVSEEPAGPVDWAFDHQKQQWAAQGKAPACKDPFSLEYTPIDMSKASAILLPGQYRGFNYKPHGGFGVVASTKGKVEVRMPMDARLVGLNRYYESPDRALQYVLDFETDCGMAFRFDHLHTLTPAFQAFADKTPAPRLDDTRSSPDDQPDPVAFKAGEVIATVVGHGIKVYQDKPLNEKAFLEICKEVIKNNRAGGWRKLQ